MLLYKEEHHYLWIGKQRKAPAKRFHIIVEARAANIIYIEQLADKLIEYIKYLDFLFLRSKYLQ